VYNALPCLADHSKAMTNFMLMGLPVLTPFLEDDLPQQMRANYGRFRITAIAMTDINGRWVHTNGDGTECPVYGYKIYHPQMGNLLYVTDTELIKYRFKDIDHVLLGINYQQKYIENSPKRNHVFRGHMELGTACDFLKVCNANKRLQNVVACHLSDSSIDYAECFTELSKTAKIADIRIAEPGLEVELRPADECPF